MALRDSRLVRRLASGQSIEEVAAGEGISIRLARERVSAILSRNPDPPAEFAQLQMRRLNEAMIVAYASLRVGNLKAVETVLKVTREYDRYAGLALTAASPASARAPAPAGAAARAPAAASQRGDAERGRKGVGVMSDGDVSHNNNII